jgi:hypothetical protein
MIDHAAPSDAPRPLDRRPVNDRCGRSICGGIACLSRGGDAARDWIGALRAALREVGG